MDSISSPQSLFLSKFQRRGIAIHSVHSAQHAAIRYLHSLPPALAPPPSPSSSCSLTYATIIINTILVYWKQGFQSSHVIPKTHFINKIGHNNLNMPASSSKIVRLMMSVNMHTYILLIFTNFQCMCFARMYIGVANELVRIQKYRRDNHIAYNGAIDKF